MDTTQYVQLIDTHTEASKVEHKEWDRWLSWYLSEYWDSKDSEYGSDSSGREGPDETISLETNYPFAYVDTMIANICPTNPSVTINARDPDQKDVASAREQLANDSLRRDKLHKQAWRVASMAGICGHGFTKTIWKNGLRRPTTSVIDPRNVFWDRTVPFAETPYIIEAVPVKYKTFEKRSKAGPDGASQYDSKVAEKADKGKYPAWLSQGSPDGSSVPKAARNVFKWVVVYEVWDFENSTFHHMLKGEPEPLFSGELPFKFVRNPFELVVFNDSLRDSSGISDVKLIRSAQERLNEIDSLELQHTHATVPHTFVNGALLDNEEDFVSSFTGADGAAPVTVVKMANETIPLSAIVHHSTTPSLSPSFDKMRDRSTQIIEFTLGIPQYARGQVGGSDIATEVALADTATRTRNGRRIKAMEDWVEAVAMKCVGLWAQFSDPDKGISVRERKGGRASMLQHADLGFDDAASFEDDWWDFEAVPYSPTEDHRMVMLQRFQQYLPMMMEHPNIDQAGLVQKLLDLLGMPELFKQDDPAAGGPGLPGAALPGAAPGQPGPQDTIATGALPEAEAERMEAIMPPGARDQASQPIVGA